MDLENDNISNTPSLKPPVITPDNKKKEDQLKELKEYQKQLTEHRKIYDDEFRKMLTYIGAGALGVIVTLNDKLFPVIDARAQWILLLSILFLTSTFGMILFVNDRASKMIGSIRDIVDSKIKNNDPSFGEDIVLKRSKNRLELKKLSNWIVFALSLGIFAEILFISVNIYPRPAKQDTAPPTVNIKLELTHDLDTIIINQDTLSFHKFKIKTNGQEKSN